VDHYALSNNQMRIAFLHRKEIDTGKWDRLIAESLSETLYPYSWYLDASAEHWSALVAEDYRFVMPLVWKRKYGIRYLYQPVFCQQLGVFSRELADPLVITEFTREMVKRFRYGVVQFNVQNLVGEEGSLQVYDRSNFVLSLEKSYSELFRAYSENTRRNLKKAMDSGARVAKDISVDELIGFKKENDRTGRPESRFLRMKSQFGAVKENSGGTVYGVRSGGHLVAAAFLARSRTRIIYLLSVSSAEGKESRAMFRIVDEVIRDHSASALHLDFEGSSIPSIARFFSGFGAQPETFQSVHFNRLPVPFMPGKNYGK
jgi:hypothetical protein